MTTPRFATPAQPFRTTVPISMAVMGTVAMSPAVARKWDTTLGKRVPSTMVRALWWTTIGVHVLESVSARRMAKAHGMPAGRWVAQTMMYGVFSLSVQKRVARDLEVAG